MTVQRNIGQRMITQRERAAMGSANRLKLGLFGANCSSGRAATEQITVFGTVHAPLIPPYRPRRFRQPPPRWLTAKFKLSFVPKILG
jgi:hypothetical protein